MIMSFVLLERHIKNHDKVDIDPLPNIITCTLVFHLLFTRSILQCALSNNNLVASTECC